MSNLPDALKSATLAGIRRLRERGTCPPDLRMFQIKAIGDIDATRAEYNKAIILALTDFGSDSSGMVVARNDFGQAMAKAFSDAFDTGYVEGGGELPAEDDDNAWIMERTDAELANINDLFFQLKDLLRNKDFDYFSWATDRAEGYCATMDGIYDQAKLRGAGNKMLTFAGQDGRPDHICQSVNGACVRLMGQRHRASWWIDHDLIPYPGNPNFECGCWECQHGLQNDNGEWYQIDPTKHMTLKRTAAQYVRLYGEARPDYTDDTLAVWIVDGKVVRDTLWIDFGAGGNDAVYGNKAKENNKPSFIPGLEIWLEQNNGNEMDFVLLHELTERREMEQNGLDYDRAHDKANLAEQTARDDPAKLPELLKAEGWK